MGEAEIPVLREDVTDRQLSKDMYQLELVAHLAEAIDDLRQRVETLEGV